MQSKKRFTETNLWETVWFSNLTPKQKLFWYFINDKCDNIGIWEPNFSLASFYLKIEHEEIFLDEFIKAANIGDVRIVILDNGNWFLPKFVKFQYVKDKPLNPKNPAHKSYLRQIKESGLSTWFIENQPEIFNDPESIPLGDLSETSKDKDMDMDMEKELEEEYDIDRDMKPIDSGFYNSPVIPNDIADDIVLDDETVDGLESIFNFTNAAERVLKIWPNSNETSGFEELLVCEELIKKLFKAGSTLIGAEKQLKNELKSIRGGNPELTLCEALSTLKSREDEWFRAAS